MSQRELRTVGRYYLHVKHKDKKYKHNFLSTQNMLKALCVVNHEGNRSNNKILWRLKRAIYAKAGHILAYRANDRQVGWAAKNGSRLNQVLGWSEAVLNRPNAWAGERGG